MLKANHHTFHQWLLGNYVRFILWRDFREIIITGDVKPDGRAVLLIPNHFSWWDGFFALHLNQKLFRKRIHLMMLERELSKRLFFTRAGAFSINHGSREVLESLNYTAQLLEDANNLVVMYPQGKLGSQHLWEVNFRKGVERVISSVNNVQIVLSALLVDYYSHRRPTLTIALKEYNGECTSHSLELAFNEHLQQSIRNQDNLFET